MLGNATLYAFVSSQTDMNTTTVTTTLVPIKEELDKAAKSFASYPASIAATKKKVEAMKTKATNPKNKVDYDENSNPFVRLYRWFAGTPWENFEEKLEKYGLDLNDIMTHLKANKATFTDNVGTIEAMQEVIGEMSESVERNTTAANSLAETSKDAIKEIDTILEKHLKAVKDAKKEYKEAHDKEVELMDKTAAKKRKEVIGKRTKKATEAIEKLETSSDKSSDKTDDKTENDDKKR